jgi:hypothetical protein
MQFDLAIKNQGQLRHGKETFLTVAELVIAEANEFSNPRVQETRTLPAPQPVVP